MRTEEEFTVFVRVEKRGGVKIVKGRCLMFIINTCVKIICKFLKHTLRYPHNTTDRIHKFEYALKYLNILYVCYGAWS